MLLSSRLISVAEVMVTVPELLTAEVVRIALPPLSSAVAAR